MEPEHVCRSRHPGSLVPCRQTNVHEPFRRSAVKSVECTRRLSARQMREYRTGRNRAIAELAGMASW